MTEQYRSASLRCPHCNGLFEESATEVALVDVCTDCGGIWVDWFDGEVAAVVASAAELAPTGRTGSSEASRSCPHCQVKLADERFRGTGPEVQRCTQCAGAFVPRSSLDELLAMGPPGDGDDVPARGLWSRIRRALGGIFDGDRGKD